MNSETVVHPKREAGDWRSQLQPDSRLRIVNKILETFKRHLPFSDEEAVRFEEKIYCAATSQSDYLRRISLKLLAVETKSQNPMVNPLQPNDASNSKNPQDSAMSGEAVVHPEREAGDWRSQLQPDSRLRIVNKIIATLKRHLPLSGEEGLLELKKIAVRFEEKIYCAAISRSDYLRSISVKMLEMETKSQNPMANPLQPNDASSSENPQDSGQNTI